MDKDLVRRISHNFLQSVTGGNYTPENIEALSGFQEYLSGVKELPKKKVALLFICINPPYWSLIKDIFEDCKKNFLPNHQTDFFLWSDIKKPEEIGEAEKTVIHNTYYLPYQGQQIPDSHIKVLNERIENRYKLAIENAEYVKNIKVFPTPARPWPIPTLLRYHLFLQQKEVLKDYDYLFYLDIDMRMVNIVGDEILGEGITAALHPMYAIKPQLIPPYEPNDKSASYIKRPGFVKVENGRPRFIPAYFAGGFQGGPSKIYLEAAEATAKLIDKDQNELNYVPIWNDESAWNKHLSENPPGLILTPSYVYPDSLIKEYYEPIWGCSYPPKIITLTKDWSIKLLSDNEQGQIRNMKDIK